jgi:predicted nucleic acid-binding protein
LLKFNPKLINVEIKDNFILSLAKDSNAVYIITGDYDLLDLEKFENTKILTINQFLQIF